MPADGALNIPAGEQLRLPLERHGASEAFVVSASNENAIRLLERWPDGAGSVLALHGPAGSGKSRLAEIWAERLGAVQGDRAQDADDESLFHLINLAVSTGSPLLLASRSAPRGWSTTLPDLRSRLDALRTVALEAPDDAVLAAILRARFAERSIAPAPEVIDYLVRRLDRSAEAAETAVERLDARHRPVTRVLAREVLDELQAESG